MTRFTRPFTLMLALALSIQVTAHTCQDARQPLVQVALLLDTSNSMDGLIDQAKSQLWKIANDFAYSKCDGQTPILEIALYEYGNSGLSRGENYIRQVIPFTRDLDKVAQQLFALRTNGGDEYCGAVIRDAVNGLTWSNRDDAYKAIFIAGNEPFTQGPTAFQESIASAVRKGIVVNPIFCGTYAEGVQTQWYAGALAGKGSYLNIDQDRSIVALPTPYDDEISRLGKDINQTYVAYNVEGQMALVSAKSADVAAMGMSATGAMTERQLFKASPQYGAYVSEWDLGARVAAKPAALDSVRKEDLPVALQNKSKEELKSYLADQVKKRDAIQTRLAKLQADRQSFLSKQQNAQGKDSLDAAVQKAVRAQAAKKGLVFRK